MPNLWFIIHSWYTACLIYQDQRASIMADRDTCHLLSSRLPITYREHENTICLTFSSCWTDWQRQEWLMQTILTSNPDSNQFISQPPPTLTTCSSYLPGSQSPVFHVARAAGQRSSLSLFLIISERCFRKSENWMCFSFRDFSELLIHSRIKPEPSFVALTRRESVHWSGVHSLCDFTWSTEQLFGKSKCPSSLLLQDCSHPTSRCPIMQLQNGQHPPHYSLH